MKKWILTLFMFVVGGSALAQKTSQIKSVNFLQEGEISKLIIDFTGKVIFEKNHVKADKQIILDVKNVQAEKRFLRGIDTSEFSGSTVFVSPYKRPGSKNDIRFAIQLRDNVRSFAELKGNRLILSIENRFGVFTRTKLKKAEGEDFTADKTGKKLLVPKSTSLNDILENLTQSGVKRYVGKKISLNVNNIPYFEVLKMIGETSGFNIIIEDDVTKLPPLTISLTNLPWDQILDTIMDLGDLVAVKFGNILTIKTAKSAREERKAELENEKNNKSLEPLVTKIFPISYAEIASLQVILQNYITPERGSIQNDTRTQQIIVKDTVEVIERIKKIIETLDTQTPQILIEARIIEAEENYDFRAGLTDGIRGNYDAFTPGSDLTDAGTFTFSSAPDLGDPSLFSVGNLNIGRFTNLAFQLELMETEQKGKIISSPKIITENSKPASIISTDQRIFIVQTGVDQNTGAAISSPTTLQAQINLTVTPKVTNEGSIAMQVTVQKDGFKQSTVDGELPLQTSKTINTNVLIDNGSTVVIGGLYQTSDEKLESGIPFLKDLPLIGWLFRTVYNPSKSRSELMVFLTPRIVNQEEAGLVSREVGDELGL